MTVLGGGAGSDGIIGEALVGTVLGGRLVVTVL